MTTLTSSDLLVDAFGRIRESVADAVEGLSGEELAFRVDDSANSLAWLVWHLTRIQDDHIADAAGLEQVWTGQGWAERFGLPLAGSDTGYGHTSAQVASVSATAEQLAGYHDAVHAQTVGYLAGLDGKALTRVVDTSWDPPVTLGVRLISVVSDNLQHAGQAAFVRGILSRR
ncbi:hypothetical protein A8W25_00335 [Streptomyces sp. ERV7]|uniref:mycothiol transferase n=1 Tax=Streptomyces sp. ERV7 TaxID=1322334 RepID=UPI0007F4B4B6|nr:DUF664 domain-containing protein [Streptomyces sp. ERV7]OAR26795.1 hypothetical protein A8W25_00335 [Streptomyces sp. ERV7]